MKTLHEYYLMWLEDNYHYSNFDIYGTPPTKIENFKFLDELNSFEITYKGQKTLFKSEHVEVKNGKVSLCEVTNNNFYNPLKNHIGKFVKSIEA